MEEMLNEAEIGPDKYIITESDNCSLQYKSAHNLITYKKYVTNINQRLYMWIVLLVIERVRLTM